MYSRHDLVWLTPAGWDSAPAHPAVAQWRANDWPAVVRRHEPGLGSDVVCLGIPLPARHRVALTVDAAHVARHRPPLPLADVLGAAPPAWLAAMVALQRAATVDLRVFGSLAMQSLTGLAYLRPASDIDVLLTPATTTELDAGVALLEQHAALLPLDGEIVFGNGDAVNWKEWLAARRDNARVLVKSLHGVRLADPATLVLS